MGKNVFQIGDANILLNKMEPGSVNLVLTDPPYDFDDGEKAKYLSHFSVIASQSIIFFPPENQWRSVLPTQYLFWEKPRSTKNTVKSYARYVEMIGIYGEGTYNNYRHYSQYSNIFSDLVEEKGLHPFRKPRSLIRRLILNHTQPGDLVLDPFAGSCVVAEVCKETGRDFIMIEQNQEYLDAARKRMYGESHDG